MQRQEQTHYQSCLTLPFLGATCKKGSILFLKLEAVGTRSK